MKKRIGRGNKLKINIFLVLALTLIIVIFLTSCSKVFFVPGASLGYFIWQDEDGNIHITWSSDREVKTFTGLITTDGKFSNVTKIGIEESDIINISEKEISFNCKLDESDYSDEIIINDLNYSYIELNLKIDGKTDLARINVGKFLNNPDSDTFKITPDYFEKVKAVPWYKNHPFVEFFKKLYLNRYLNFVYIFVLGAIIIEILRITKFSSSKRRGLKLLASYMILFLLDIGFFIFLLFVNAS